MTNLTESLRAIRPWQVVVLVAVPLIVAGAVYGVYAWLRRFCQCGNCH